MTVSYNELSLGVDPDEASRVLARDRGKNTDVWKSVLDGFLSANVQFDRIDPTKLGLTNGEGQAPKPASVAGALASYAKNRNLPATAKSYGDGSILLARIEVDGPPKEPAKAGRRKGRKGEAPEAE